MGAAAAWIVITLEPAAPIVPTGSTAATQNVREPVQVTGML